MTNQTIPTAEQLWELIIYSDNPADDDEYCVRKSKFIEAYNELSLALTQAHEKKIAELKDWKHSQRGCVQCVMKNQQLAEKDKRIAELESKSSVHEEIDSELRRLKNLPKVDYVLGKIQMLEHLQSFPDKRYEALVERLKALPRYTIAGTVWNDKNSFVSGEVYIKKDIQQSITQSEKE